MESGGSSRECFLKLLEAVVEGVFMIELAGGRGGIRKMDGFVRWRVVQRMERGENQRS